MTFIILLNVNTKIYNLAKITLKKDCQYPDKRLGFTVRIMPKHISLFYFQ